MAIITTMTRSERAKKKARMHGDGHRVPSVIVEIEKELDKEETILRKNLEDGQIIDQGHVHQITLMKIDLDSLYANWEAGAIE